MVSSSILRFKSTATTPQEEDHSADDYETKCGKQNQILLIDEDDDGSNSESINITEKLTTISPSVAAAAKSSIQASSISGKLYSTTTPPMTAIEHIENNSNRFNTISLDKSILVNLVGDLYDCKSVSFDSELTTQVKSKVIKNYKLLFLSIFLFI